VKLSLLIDYNFYSIQLELSFLGFRVSSVILLSFQNYNFTVQILCKTQQFCPSHLCTKWLNVSLECFHFISVNCQVTVDE